jgi:galactose mutarotase-like enzyme
MQPSAERLTFGRGVGAVRLGNDQISVTVLVDKGGDIYELVHRPTGIDVLWKSGLGVRGLNEGRFAADSSTAWLECYEGGWQEILPNGGAPYDYKGVELSFHGESTMLPWEVESLDSTVDVVTLILRVQLFRSPFLLRRKMSVRADRAALFLEEEVTNLAGEPMEFMWGHHPAFGAPFLDGGVRLWTNAQTLVADNEFDAPSNLLQPGSHHRFPQITTRLGETHNFSIMPPSDQERGTLAYLSDFDGSPYYALTNPRLSIGVGMAWTPNVFKYLWLWQEMHASGGFPFYKRAYTMAVEPWSSIPGSGLGEAIKAKTQLQLQPKETLSTALTVVLLAVTDKTVITSVGLDGSVQ